jgi:hypothetical protein
MDILIENLHGAGKSDNGLVAAWRRWPSERGDPVRVAGGGRRAAPIPAEHGDRQVALTRTLDPQQPAAVGGRPEAAYDYAGLFSAWAAR